MSKRPMYKSSPRSSEINKFELLLTHKVRFEIFRFVMNKEHDNNMDDLWIWCEFRKKIELFSQWEKANVGIVSKVLETNEFWIAFGVSESQCWNCLWRLENQWVWIAFAMSEKPMLGSFLKSRKPMNLNYFRKERKPMLGLFSKVTESNEFKLLL
jgi:hypothetical protein